MKEEFEKILKEFENKRISLLQILNYVNDKKGFIDEKDVEEISEFLEIPKNEIKSLISFYHFLNFNKKKKRIYVCSNITCLLKGAEEIISFLKSFPEIEVVETECIGQCDNAPCCIIENKIYKNLTKEKIKDLIKDERD
jgi:NADH-quinone oxidoreductase subunit E